LDPSNHRQVDPSETPESAKKLKTTSTSSPSSKTSLKNTPIAEADYQPPKSKKELRALKKAARKRKEVEENDESQDKFLSEEEYKQQKQREKKEKRKAMMQELRKQERENKKIRQQRKLNRERNAPKWKQAQVEAKDEPKHQQQQSEKKNKKKAKTSGAEQEEQDIAMKALKQVFRGSTDESGMTTTTLGVKYKDIVVGTGDEVREKKLVTVQYQLKGGKFKAVLDSSKKFNFRLGKGEVIQGWDIGLMGMRVGGRRQLIVPPKAGYGSQDIGAGPGGLLYFDITLLAIR